MNDNDRTNYTPSFDTMQCPSRRKGLLRFLKCILVPQEDNTRGGVSVGTVPRLRGEGTAIRKRFSESCADHMAAIPIPKELMPAWRIAVLPNDFPVSDGVGLSCMSNVVAVLSNRHSPGRVRRTYMECGRYIGPHRPIFRALWALHKRVGT